MKSALCRKLGIEFPLFAFSHCRDVVAAVSNAGGFGVLGAVAHTAESLEIDLKWIDEHVNGKPYGIDLLIPNKMEDKEGGLTSADLEARVPPEHRRHVAGLLAKHGIDTGDLWTAPQGDHDEVAAPSGQGRANEPGDRRSQSDTSSGVAVNSPARKQCEKDVGQTQYRVQRADVGMREVALCTQFLDQRRHHVVFVVVPGDSQGGQRQHHPAPRR